MGKNVGGTKHRRGEKKRYEKKSVLCRSQGQPCFIYLSIKWVISAQTSACFYLSLALSRTECVGFKKPRSAADWRLTDPEPRLLPRSALGSHLPLLFQLPRGLFHSFVGLIWLGSLACSLQHLLYGSFSFFTTRSGIPPLHLSLSSLVSWLTHLCCFIAI